MLKVITIRVPEELHSAVHEAAHDKRTSMNKFCEETLLRRVAELNSPQPASAADNAASGEAVRS